jgi:hypothetical protein
MNWLRKLLCRHTRVAYRHKLYGDIIMHYKYRCMYECLDCGRWINEPCGKFDPDLGEAKQETLHESEADAQVRDEAKGE